MKVIINKNQGEEMKKATKKIIKKPIVGKKVRPSKKRPIIAKKLIVSKKLKYFKSIGIFATIGGALGMVALVSVGLVGVLTPEPDISPVLGVSSTINSEVVSSMPTVKTPTNVKTTITKKGVMVSWTGSTEADGYIIYRKAGLVGSKLQIASTVRPTIYKDGNAQAWPKTGVWPLGYYIDTAVRKNSFVTYYVVATRDYCLSTAAGTCGVAKSAMAKGKMTWNNSAFTNTAVFKVYSLSAKTISVDAILDITKKYYVKVSCNDGSSHCRDLSKDNLLSISGQTAGAPYTYRLPLTYLNQKNGYHRFVLNGLQMGTTYKVEISLLTPMGFSDTEPGDGSLYETIIGMPKQITTSSTIEAPTAPTGFKFSGMMAQSDGGSAGTYKWDVPEKPVDGYDMTMSCQSNRLYYQFGVIVGPSTWSGEISLKDINYLSSGYATIGYGFEQYDLGTGRGLCTFTLTPYNYNTSGGKAIGQSATTVFGDVTSKPLSTPATPTGLKYNDQFDNGKVVWLAADVPAVAPEGYMANVDCTKSGVTTNVLTDYVPYVGYATTSDPNSGAEVHYLEINLNDFGVGHGSCTAKINAFNYGFTGDKYFSGYETVTFNN